MGQDEDGRDAGKAPSLNIFGAFGEMAARDMVKWLLVYDPPNDAYRVKEFLWSGEQVRKMVKEAGK